MADRPQVGQALQRALAERGCELTLAEARRLALALLVLAEDDLLEPVSDRSPSGGPHVYDMGPFQYKERKEVP